MTTLSVDMDAPPPAPAAASPPRPLTPRGRRRSWNEPTVRAWLLMALAMFLVTAGSLLYELSVARTARYRIAQWKRVDNAQLIQLGDSHRESYRVPPDQLATLPVKLEYVDAKGATHELTGHLTAQAEAVHPTKIVPILVNPADPEQWTDRVSPPPVFEQLFGLMILLPLLVMLVAAAVWQRWRILALWRGGVAREGTVVYRRHSAVAPRSAILYCTVDTAGSGSSGGGGGDKRLLGVAVPRRTFAFEPDDRITLITPNVARPDRAIAAIMYE